MPNPIVHENLLSAVATGTGTAISAAKCARGYQFTTYTKFSAGVSAGVVKIETADDENYTGTWHTLATVTYASGAPLQVASQFSGPLAALRARVSTNITGGTVDVVVVIN